MDSNAQQAAQIFRCEQALDCRADDLYSLVHCSLPFVSRATISDSVENISINAAVAITVKVTGNTGLSPVAGAVGVSVAGATTVGVSAVVAAATGVSAVVAATADASITSESTFGGASVFAEHPTMISANRTKIIFLMIGFVFFKWVL